MGMFSHMGMRFVVICAFRLFAMFWKYIKVIINNPSNNPFAVYKKVKT